jgi:hypothetical protein
VKTVAQAQIAALKYSDQLVLKLTELEIVGPFDSRRTEALFKKAIELHFLDGFHYAREGVE